VAIQIAVLRHNIVRRRDRRMRFVEPDIQKEWASGSRPSSSQLIASSATI
jgi:hypothetical protein